MKMSNALRLCAFLLAGMAAGCSGSSSTASKASSPPAESSATTVMAASPEAAASASSESNLMYPDWAAAVVPDYPNIIDQALVRDNFYQITSADDPAAVLAWYRSHVSGAWATPASPDNWVLPSANGVRIEIDKVGYGNQPAGTRPKTMICLNRIVNGQAQPC